MGSTSIVDLEDIVKARAWTAYERSRTFWQPRKFRDVKLEVDWSGVSFIPEKPRFKKDKTEQNSTVKEGEPTKHVDKAGDGENTPITIEPTKHIDNAGGGDNASTEGESTEHVDKTSDGKNTAKAVKKYPSCSSERKGDKKSTNRPITSIIFTSVFENNSKLKQTHSLKAERSTTATCKSSLTCGFTRGLNVGLTLACPKSIVKASVGYSEGFSLTGATESTEQRTLTWTIEGCLIVAPESRLKAQVHIIEKREKYLFTTTVAIKGFVAVKMSKRTNNKFIKTWTGDMQTILSRTSKTEKNLKIAKTEGDTVFLTVSGQCLFNYGIKQQTVISKGESLKSLDQGTSAQNGETCDLSDTQDTEESSDYDCD